MEERMKNILSTVTLHWLLQISPKSIWSTGNGAQHMEGRWEETQCDLQRSQLGAQSSKVALEPGLLQGVTISAHSCRGPGDSTAFLSGFLLGNEKENHNTQVVMSTESP